ncbi:MAG: transposase [Myxococcota bacterium]
MKAFKGSPIAKALQYLENWWDHLTVFLDDPRVPLTSNAVERSLRGPVLGRNNHFGSRSQRGTEVAALFYSLIESSIRAVTSTWPRTLPFAAKPSRFLTKSTDGSRPSQLT